MMLQGTSQLLVGATKMWAPLNSSTKVDVVIGASCIVALVWLRAQLRLRRRRVRRSYYRSMRHSSQRRQIKSLSKQGVMRKAAAAGKAKWAFRKAVAIAVLIVVCRIWIEVHGK